jgi:hypothetical protein
MKFHLYEFELRQGVISPCARRRRCRRQLPKAVAPAAAFLLQLMPKRLFVDEGSMAASDRRA